MSLATGGSTDTNFVATNQELSFFRYFLNLFLTLCLLLRVCGSQHKYFCLDICKIFWLTPGLYNSGLSGECHKSFFMFKDKDLEKGGGGLVEATGALQPFNISS